MAHGANVLSMLIPTANFSIEGDDYASIVWIDGKQLVTKEQFEAGFAQYDAWKAEQEAKAAADKVSATAKLEALGLTVDDLKALGL
jgi:hypothetical protein